MRQPTFDTDRLVLRPRSMADLEHCLAMDRDPAVTRYIPGPWSDPVRHRAFVIERIECRYPGGLGYWSILDKDATNEFLGWILLLPYGPAGEEVEIGWRLCRRCWGHGNAVEAVMPVLEHGFVKLGLDLVVADIHPANAASIRVAEKLGMDFVEDRLVDGRPALSYQATAAPPC